MRKLPGVVAHRALRLIVAGFICLASEGQAGVETPASDPADRGGTLPEPVPTTVTPRRQRAVFVCQDEGIPVFTDRPCGTTTVSRSLIVAMPGAGAPPTTLPPAPRFSTRPLPAPNVAPGRTAATRCTQLQHQLDELNDRMRSGYSAREAARLWQRWRDLKDRLRRERC